MICLLSKAKVTSKKLLITFAFKRSLQSCYSTLFITGIRRITAARMKQTGTLISVATTNLIRGCSKSVLIKTHTATNIIGCIR
jgi:hypothetical protein